MTTQPPASTTLNPARWRSEAAMLLGVAAVAIGLATMPALSVSAAPVPPKTATVSGSPRTAIQQPPYMPSRHIHPRVAGTAAGMPPTAQVFYAVVNSNGTLAKGFQATRTLQLGTGIYEVDFSQAITGCAYLGTIGLTGSIGVSPPGQIAVVGRYSDPNGVFVETFNSAGASTNLSFHLGVLC